MADIFSTGVTGLNVAQAALNTIAQNVSNANTPGYARQVVQVTTQSPSRQGAGYAGNGVMVSGIASLVSPYLEAQLTRATAMAAHSSELSGYFGQLQGIMGDGASGISTNQASFQSSLGQVASNPSSIPARQLVLTNAQALMGAVNSAAAQMQTQKQGAAQTLNSDISQANTLLRQIANYNDVITKAEPRDTYGNVLDGQKANDLRTQRQTLINQLAELTNVTTVDQNEGVSVMIGGAAVVISNKASALSAQQDPLDPTQTTVGIATSAGQVRLDAATLGGKIGATLEFVETGINQGMAELNQYASILAKATNDQLGKGVDMYGQPGSPMFSVEAPTVLLSSKNTGTLAVGASVDLYQAKPSDYSLSYTTAGGYVMTRLSDNINVASGATLPLTADGLTLSPTSGAPADGDSYLIRPFGSQASNVKVLLSDPKQLALANPVATSASQTNASHAEISPAKVVSGLPLDPNLTANVSITFTSSTQYTISGPGIGTLTNQPYTAGTPISYNGWEVKLTGAPANGDSFTIKGSSGALGDGSNANALGSLLQGKNFVGNSQSLADLYANMQSNVGNKANLAQTTAKSDSSVLGIATNQRESYSGVNLDQEAADLARWQQIYAANAQVLSIAQKLFENLMQQLG